jgi:predicted ATPase/signal transduction histidine kinase
VLPFSWAKAVVSLHIHNIIHKDLKPANIIINPETGLVKLTDFSIASRLSKETPQLTNPNQLEGTLGYISPEQTGRMNRVLDYRTDFYSLGVTFYEMLVGELPFQSDDPLELIHSHIAKQPKAIEELNPSIPVEITAIVRKLMAKNAEDRYQTAKGLLADLEICLSEFKTTGKISNFIPGRLDILSQLLIPQKLYGRETQVNSLLEAFENVSQGSSALVLVSGYSGIGKSSVVNEVNKPITRQKGYFISGKFDQFKRNIPYASLIQAFSYLMRQLLTENDTKLEQWRSQILQAVGSNGQVIIDVIPEVELIIGKQPEVAQLGPAESQNRFNRVLTEFIRVFSQKEHPLVIFLDDLQWADSATLKLMQLLITDPQSKYLLLIGAYRDNEVSSTHPLIQAIEEIEKSDKVINNIVLQTLSLNNVTQLVTETLTCNAEKIEPLAELIYNKTAGNPFFLTQLLQTLYQEKLLRFDYHNYHYIEEEIKGTWQWNIEEILAIGITDKNVVELVASRIQKLPLATQEILKLAACVGDKFTLDVLSIIKEESPGVTANQLYPSLQAGLILPLNETYKIPLLLDEDGHSSGESKHENLESRIKGVGYKFLHDRVQQAAYSLIPESEKQATHLKIGQLLLKQTPPEFLAENILDVVNQLNVGLELLSSPAEKEELAKLNFTAGEKAKAATAYEAAVKYLNIGLQLLAEDSWQSNYDLTLDFYVETAEAEYLTGSFERSKKLADLTLQQANTILDKVRIYEIQIQSCIAQNSMLEALDVGVDVLRLLGVGLPKKPTMQHLLLAVLQTKFILSNKRIEDLADLPEMTDPYKLAAMQILMLVNPAAAQAGSLLFPLSTLTLVRLSVKYGNSAPATYGYSIYGAMLCHNFGDIEAGYRFGKLGISLLDNLNANLFKGKVLYSFNAFIAHFKEPTKEKIVHLRRGIQFALETGDIEFASYSAWTLNKNLFLSGENLDSLSRQILQYVSFTQQLKLESVALVINIIRQTALNLQGHSSNKYVLVGDAFDETEMLCTLSKNTTWLSIFHSCKTCMNYFFHRYDEAIKSSELIIKYKESNPGFFLYSVNNFYHSLALLAQYINISKSEQKKYLNQVAINQKKMKQWAQHAPCNFQHKYDLVEAERLRLLGQETKAMNLYDRAIAGAKENGYTQDEALANELAASFYVSFGKEKIAKIYMTEAYYGYIRWGAFAKVKDLEERYPNLILRSYNPTSEGKDLTRTITTSFTRISNSTSNSNEVFDLATVMKATEAITSEIILDNLLDKLLKIILENAAAEKGCLILLKDNKLFIEAQRSLVGQAVTNIIQSIPVQDSTYIPLSLINYVARTKEYVIFKDAITQIQNSKSKIQNFNDPYFQVTQPKSVLCAPIFYQGKFTGILYLENNESIGAFTTSRLEILKLLGSQAAIAIENARLYAGEQEKSQQLQESLEQLQQTQAQLVQTEKISSLGQLVAGVAHEVNNPVGFIMGNLDYAKQYIDDLLKLVHLYQEHNPSPAKEITNYIKKIDFEFLVSDLPKMISSMEVGTERIRGIMQSLRNFSRVDSSDKKAVDIHEGIETTLMILQHRLKPRQERPAIQIVKKYGDLPLVKCYSGQLNQVFMNLLANAIDALDEYNQGRTYLEIEKNPNIITITTELVTLEEELAIGQENLTNEKITNEKVVIRIADNGPGMPEAVRKKLFNPFFTTKPEGKGTGLGLSISFQIVTEKHGGVIECISSPGEGACFVIQLPLEAELPSS